MSKKILILLFIFSTVTLIGNSLNCAFGDSSMYNRMIGKNNCYISVLGRGLQNGVNYERFFLRKKKILLGAGAGLDYPFLLTHRSNIFTIPVYLNSYVLENKHKLVGGIGLTSLINLKPSSTNHEQYVTTSIIPSVGYAYIGPKGFLFRAEYVLLNEKIDKHRFYYSYAQLVFGFNFNMS